MAAFALFGRAKWVVSSRRSDFSFRSARFSFGGQYIEARAFCAGRPALPFFSPRPTRSWKVIKLRLVKTRMRDTLVWRRTGT